LRVTYAATSALGPLRVVPVSLLSILIACSSTQSTDGSVPPVERSDPYPPWPRFLALHHLSEAVAQAAEQALAGQSESAWSALQDLLDAHAEAARVTLDDRFFIELNTLLNVALFDTPLRGRARLWSCHQSLTFARAQLEHATAAPTVDPTPWCDGLVPAAELDTLEARAAEATHQRWTAVASRMAGHCRRVQVELDRWKAQLDGSAETRQEEVRLRVEVYRRELEETTTIGWELLRLSEESGHPAARTDYALLEEVETACRVSE
jgi:hypothetical protein